MNKDVGMFIAIVGIDVFVNLMTYETDKVVRVCLGCEFSGHHVGMHLVLLKGVLQQWCVAKLFITEIFTKHFEQVEHKCIYKVCGTFKFFFEFLHLSTHLILLVRRVLVYVVVVEYVAAFLVLKLWRTQVFIQLWYSHALHIFYNCLLMSFISYG